MPSIEIFRLDNDGNVSVRLSNNHGIWAHGKDVREAIRGLMRTARTFDMPYRVEEYNGVVLVDLVCCEAFDEYGADLYPPRMVDAWNKG
jgi:hypothetical protein